MLKGYSDYEKDAVRDYGTDVRGEEDKRGSWSCVWTCYTIELRKERTVYLERAKYIGELIPFGSLAGQISSVVPT